jgi:hypothetical protein|eukprot:SAG25_NODE_371_length_9000_cov_6.528480_5_plen_199_part_00
MELALNFARMRVCCSTILVTVDGTLICGGIIVMYSGVDAGGETHAFSDLLAFSVYCAYALGVVMIIMVRAMSLTNCLVVSLALIDSPLQGILFMFIKQRAMADGEAFFDEHPQKSFVFAIVSYVTEHTTPLYLSAIHASAEINAGACAVIGQHDLLSVPVGRDGDDAVYRGQRQRQQGLGHSGVLAHSPSLLVAPRRI